MDVQEVKEAYSDTRIQAILREIDNTVERIQQMTAEVLEIAEQSQSKAAWEVGGEKQSWK